MMKNTLFALLLMSMALCQFDNTIAGWYNEHYYVPGGTVYSEGLVVADESTLAAESLNEVDFATHAKWDVTNDFDDTGGNAAFIWSANQTSTLTQTQVNLVTAGVSSRWYVFTYTLAVTTVFDGDAAATITTSFALSAVPLEIVTAGTYTLYFKSAVTPTDFVISIVSGSDTEGTISYDDLTLKEITGGDIYVGNDGFVGGDFTVTGDVVARYLGDDIVQSAATEFELKAVGASAGDNSYHLSFEGVTSGGAREFDMYMDADAGTDTYRLIWALNGGGIGMAMNESGNVGIGTDSPGGTLEVNGPNPGDVGGFAAGALQVTAEGTSQFTPAVITGHNSYNTNTQLWYLGSHNSSDDNIALINRLNAELNLATNNITRMTISGAGAISFPAGYSRHIELQVGSAVVGSTAPSPTTVGTFRGLGFNADNEVANFIFDVPTDWDGVSDMTAHVHWYPTSGDAVANGETVKWDITYRSIAEGEAVDNGTAVTASGTLTGGASETDKELYYTEIVLDYNHADQPLTAEDCVGIQFDRDVTTDTYSGAGIITMLHIQYNSIALPEG